MFVAVGLLLSEGIHVIEPDVSHEVVKILAEVTLVWVLFADAARVRLRELRADLGLYTRLLAVGLPLTIAAGALLAMWLFDGMGVWMALLVGAALAPTDAALGAAVMTDPAVPERVRRVLNVESGLNDGIATPVVTVAIAGARRCGQRPGPPSLGGALTDLAIGLAVGVVVGVVGGRAMRMARRRGWATEDLAGPGVLALALAAYAGTLWLGGNGFVAAFVAGLAFGNFAGRGGVKEVFYVEQTAGLVSLVTWLIFGAVAVPTVFEHTDWQVDRLRDPESDRGPDAAGGPRPGRFRAVAADRRLHRLVRTSRPGLDHLRADRPRRPPCRGRPSRGGHRDDRAAQRAGARSEREAARDPVRGDRRRLHRRRPEQG